MHVNFNNAVNSYIDEVKANRMHCAYKRHNEQLSRRLSACRQAAECKHDIT